jgi:hypothetical protein
MKAKKFYVTIAWGRAYVSIFYKGKYFNLNNKDSLELIAQAVKAAKFKITSNIEGNRSAELIKTARQA